MKEHWHKHESITLLHKENSNTFTYLLLYEATLSSMNLQHSDNLQSTLMIILLWYVCMVNIQLLVQCTYYETGPRFYLRTVGQYLSLSSFPSCSSPRNSTASMMAAQVGGGWSRPNQVASISMRQLWGSRWCSSAMLKSVPFGISKRTPITFHLSATLW